MQLREWQNLEKHESRDGLLVCEHPQQPVNVCNSFLGTFSRDFCSFWHLLTWRRVRRAVRSREVSMKVRLEMATVSPRLHWAQIRNKIRDQQLVPTWNSLQRVLPTHPLQGSSSDTSAAGATFCAGHLQNFKVSTLIIPEDNK